MKMSNFVVIGDLEKWGGTKEIFSTGSFEKWWQKPNHIQEIYKLEAEQIQRKPYLGTSLLSCWQNKDKILKLHEKTQNNFMGETIRYGWLFNRNY